MSVLYIVNPISGNGKKRRIVSHLKGRVEFTRYAGHAEILAGEASEDTVVAVGGDGTVNEVARGLVGTEKTLGIIVPYRQQIAMIRNLLSDEFEMINIDTVERYQGSQRDIIIYTTTISTTEQLSLLSAPIELDGQLIDRKLNVAITRARKHLYIVGNRSLLNQSPIYRELLSAMTDKK